MKCIQPLLPCRPVAKYVDVLHRRLLDSLQDRRITDRHDANVDSIETCPGSQVCRAVFPDPKPLRHSPNLRFDVGDVLPIRLLKVIDDGARWQLVDDLHWQYLDTKDHVG